jgi:hypothetical protein
VKKCPRCKEQTLVDVRRKYSLSICCQNPACGYQQMHYVDSPGAYAAAQKRVTPDRLPPRNFVHGDVWGRGASWLPAGEGDTAKQRKRSKREGNPQKQWSKRALSSKSKVARSAALNRVSKSAVVPLQEGYYRSYEALRRQDRRKALDYLLKHKLVDKSFLTREFLLAKHLYLERRYDEAYRRIRLCARHIKETKDPQPILDLKARIENALQGFIS